MVLCSMMIGWYDVRPINEVSFKLFDRGKPCKNSLVKPSSFGNACDQNPGTNDVAIISL